MDDVLEYAARAARHAPSRAALDEELTLPAVLYELAIVGEAASRTSPDLRSGHPEVPWARIVSLRNILVHAYDRIDLDLVWDAVERLSGLVASLERIREGLPEL